MVIDESIYEFEGECPVRKYIPRKPHPNGLETFGLASYLNIGTHRLPVVLDLEPYTIGNELTPQEAMIRLHSRIRDRFPQLVPSLVVDSAFGSFDRLEEIVDAGGNATMSMASQVKPWLWETLNWDCGLDQGRVALLPQHNVVVASYQVLSETGSWHQLKMISSACGIERADDEEKEVMNVDDRREARGRLEYLTHFSDGSEEWLAADQFIDVDGTVNLSWLNFVSAADLERAFSSFTQAQLKVLPVIQNIH